MFALLMVSDAIERSPMHPESDVVGLGDRMEQWLEEGNPEAGPVVFTAYFLVAIALVFALSYATIWVLTHVL
jgi:hypothetical protein